MQVLNTSIHLPFNRTKLTKFSTNRKCNSRRHKYLEVKADLLTDLVKPLTQLGQKQDLKTGISQFYDQSSGLWEQMWGEHMHHGLYFPGKEGLDNTQAQIEMIEETLKWADVQSVQNVLDVGCGIGGSSRYLCTKYQCSGTGITLSPKQAQRGNEINVERGLADRVKLQVADALDMPFQSDSFDLVWSLESGEHMPNKKKFVSELCRVATPGGRIIIVTWCHRVLQPGEQLTIQELELLERIKEAYYLPDWCSVADYENLLKVEGINDIKSEDWSDFVAPFWGKVIESALTPQGVTGLLSAGWDTIKGALVMPLMSEGYKMGLIKFVLVSGVKSQ